jgi:plasmid maintenance system killer protein
VIKTFANKWTAEIWRTGKTRGSPRASVTKRTLALLDAVAGLDDLKCSPGNRRKNRAETGKGGTGFASATDIEIGFVWRGHDAFEVEITDYH